MCFGEWVPVFWTNVLLPSTGSRIFVTTNCTYHITEAMQRDPCIFQEYVLLQEPLATWGESHVKNE